MRTYRHLIRKRGRRWHAFGLYRRHIYLEVDFPSWREAYDYAHTHPSNRKETT